MDFSSRQSEPIKRDQKLDDTAMGLLSGAAFAVFYVTAAIPLARLADRGSRRNLIVACLTVWSICTALCGFVTSCFQSTIARMGVAGGEAGAYPASQSILADLYPPSSSSAAGSPRRSWCRGRREHAAQRGDNQIPPPTLPFRGREAERLRRSI